MCSCNHSPQAEASPAVEASGANAAHKVHAEAPVLNPPLSAEDLHRTLQQTFILGNRARREFVRALLILYASKKYLLLGHSSVEQYAERQFGYGPTHTYELLRVARRLEDLPRCDGAFRNGALSWSVLKELARVATAQTEEEWLEFARKHSFGRVKAEVKDAVKKGRPKPRGDSYGLPAIEVEVSFKLKPEENEILEKALRKIGHEMGKSLVGEGPEGSEGAYRPEAKDALMVLANLYLQTDPAGVFQGREPRQAPLYQVVYRLCPGCHAAHVHTADGPVEVQPEVVERIEGEAERVHIRPEEETPGGKDRQPSKEAGSKSAPAIDRPNTRSLRRKVLLRDGNICANPRCRRSLGLHAHHIVLRCEGGKTALWNEVAVCALCHALSHAGFLLVQLKEDGEIVWRARAQWLASVDEVARQLGSMQTIQVASGAFATVEVPGGVTSPRPSAGLAADADRPPSEQGSKADEKPQVMSKSLMETTEYAIAGMHKLGWTKKVARERVAEVLEVFRSRKVEPTLDELFNPAIRAGSV